VIKSLIFPGSAPSEKARAAEPAIA
jgi:hypothetical protein